MVEGHNSSNSSPLSWDWLLLSQGRVVIGFEGEGELGRLFVEHCILEGVVLFSLSEWPFGREPEIPFVWTPDVSIRAVGL